MKCACVSCLFADKTNNSKVMSLFAHPGRPTALQQQKNRSLFLKQCTRGKKIAILRALRIPPQKPGTIHFLSTLICLHCTRGYCGIGKPARVAALARICLPLLSLPLCLSGGYSFGGEGRKGWFSILKENLQNKYSKRKPQPRFLKGRTSTIDISKLKDFC